MIDIKSKEEDYKNWSDEAKKYYIDKGIDVPWQNAIDINNEVEKHINELVIDLSDEVVRLIDCLDGDDDYYYIYETSKKNIVYSSCVGRFYALKGYLPKDDYDSLVNIWNMNHIDNAI